MTLEEFQFPKNWFEDEVREGVFVSTTMKRNWAGQLEVLREIDRVSKELGLTWYLEGGTLLGAVRHNGFVPWDDDIDICMMRRDIETFRQKAYSFLPDGYFIVDPRDESDVNVDVFRVVATKRVQTEESYVLKHYSPFVVGVDIFPLDNYLDDDEEYEKSRAQLLVQMKGCCNYLEDGRDPTDEAFVSCVKYCEEKLGVSILGQKDMVHELWKQLVMMYSQVKDDTTKRVKIFFGKKEYIYERQWYGVPKMLCFEGIDLPVPVEYEKVLQVEYGNQKYISRGASAHNYPGYEPSEKIIADRLDIYPFRYKYRQKDIEVNKTETPRAIANKLIDMLEKLQEALENAAGSSEKRTELLISEQKLTLALINQMESLFTGKNGRLTDSLQAYGKEVFTAFSEWNVDSFSTLNESFIRMRTIVGEALDGRRNIVFLPCRVKWWGTMEKLWRYAKELTGANVYVSPIAWYEEPTIGVRGVMHDETAAFPGELHVLSRSELDLTALHPEAIVIQVPYDNMGSFMMIDDENCSYRLKNMTEKLIYVPCFDPATPAEGDKIAVKAMENLIEQPAVMFADEVRVPTSRMREVYIETLVGLSGEDKREYWTKKIKADDCMELSVRDTVF